MIRVRLQLISRATETNRNGSACCCWGQKEAAGWYPAQERLLMQSVAGVPRGDGDDGISWWRYWPHPDGDADGGDNEGGCSRERRRAARTIRLKTCCRQETGLKQKHRGARKRHAIKKSQPPRPRSSAPRVSSLYRPDETVGPRL